MLVVSVLYFSPKASADASFSRLVTAVLLETGERVPREAEMGGKKDSTFQKELVWILSGGGKKSVIGPILSGSCHLVFISEKTS